MNENTLKLITQTSIAVLVLGVLVWALHTWNLERERQAQSQDQQRVLLIEIMTGAVKEAHDDRRHLTKTIQTMSREMLEREVIDKQIIALLQQSVKETNDLHGEMSNGIGDILEAISGSAKTISRSVKK